jgi:hypothetical protein
MVSFVTFSYLHMNDGYLGKPNADEWIAMVSGLNIGSPTSAVANVQMLVEYLAGELGGNEDIQASSRVSRLIIAGNSLASGGLALSDKENEGADGKPVSLFIFCLALLTDLVNRFVSAVKGTQLHSLHTPCRISHLTFSILPE